MIESLNGIYETVNYKQATSLKLYVNDEYEDYPSHWHTSIEIIMPLENIYTVECGGQTTILREGDIILICPGCIHTLTAPEKGKRIIFQLETAPLRFMKDIDTLLTLFSPVIVITPEKYPTVYDRLKVLLEEITEEYLKQAATFMEVYIYSKFLEMITLIGSNSKKEETEAQAPAVGKQEEYMKTFFEICDYISLHCSEDLTLEDVAARSGFSKFYFSRLFKQYVNVSFYKYVNQKRIEKAAALLTEPKNSITDVALNCGFSSLSSFIRMFRIVKGCTPTEFRSMYQSPGSSF